MSRYTPNARRASFDWTETVGAGLDSAEKRAVAGVRNPAATQDLVARVFAKTALGGLRKHEAYFGRAITATLAQVEANLKDGKLLDPQMSATSERPKFAAQGSKLTLER